MLSTSPQEAFDRHLYSCVSVVALRYKGCQVVRRIEDIGPGKPYLSVEMYSHNTSARERLIDPGRHDPREIATLLGGYIRGEEGVNCHIGLGVRKKEYWHDQ